MTDGACWIESTDELPITVEVCPTGAAGPDRISVPIWDRDCARWVEGWARERGLASRRCGWGGDSRGWFVCQVQVTRDQLVDFCEYLKAPAREKRIHDDGIEAFQAFVAKSLDPTRTYLLAGDTF